MGISGSPRSTKGQGSVHAIRRCQELGIDALEMAWVHKVTVSQAGAERIRAAAEAADVSLSVHAPYYINLNSRDPDIVAASIDRIFAAGQAASWSGAGDVVLHLAYYHDDPPGDVFERVAAGLLEGRCRLDAAGYSSVTLRPETMGRASQFGGLEETLRLCRMAPGIQPCIDIAHLHARSVGGWNDRTAFHRLWDTVAEALPEGSSHPIHVHMSGIEYGELGERRHSAFDAADLDYRTFLEVIAERELAGTIIVESPEREDDVLLLKRSWREIVR